MPVFIPLSVDGKQGTYVETVAFDVATAARHEIVAAVTGRKIVVISVIMVAAGAVTVTWESATDGITGALALVANGGFSAQSPYGIFHAEAAEALNLSLGAAVQVGGAVTYMEV